MRFFPAHKVEMVDPDRALPGRPRAITVPGKHLVLGTPIAPPFPERLDRAMFALGCFWGAERRFFELEGVYTTAVGYSGGYTPNPTYEEVCSGRTGHAEVVLVVYDPAKIAYRQLLSTFFESHDPTQGMRQGNDLGTQYRSAIYVASNDQAAAAAEVKAMYEERLQAAGFDEITTEIAAAGPFYYAEDYHQQYLAVNPWGYCGLGATGVACPVDAGANRQARAGTDDR